jgi:hypothetical protein
VCILCFELLLVLKMTCRTPVLQSVTKCASAITASCTSLLSMNLFRASKQTLTDSTQALERGRAHRAAAIVDQHRGWARADRRSLFPHRMHAQLCA